MPSSQSSGKAGRASSVFAAYRARANRFCEQRLSELCDAAGPALLGFAETAESEAAQSLFFAAVTQIDEKSAAIKARFHRALEQGLMHFFSGKRGDPRPWLPRRDIVGTDQREINTGAKDDEARAIKNLIIRTNARCFPELYALSQRLAVIAGGIKLRDDEIPAGPHHLAHSFRAALEEHNFDIRVKVVLYALFHHRLTWSAADLYRELNEVLRTAGILPKTRPVNLRPTRRPDQQLGARLDRLPDLADHQAMHQALVSELMTLANGRRDTVISEGASARLSSAPAPLNDFLRSLEQSSGQALPLAPQPVERGESIPIATLDKVNADTRDPELLHGIEQLFAQMLDMPGLPALAKTTLAHLQIPYLRAAAADISLLRDAQHPARLLLDECSEAGSHWIDESDPRQGILPILRLLVERILDTPPEETPPFAALLDVLHQHIQRLRKPRDLSERRCQDLCRDRINARQAGRHARDAILELFRRHDVPRQVRVFLDTTWVELLTLVQLHRHEGPDSPSWHEALDTARTLVELFDPRLTGAALHARITELPRLRQRLAYGAQRLGSHNRATLAALDALLANPHGVREYLRQAQNLTQQTPVRRPNSDPPVNLSEESLSDEQDKITTPETEPSASALQAMIEELRKTKSGTWFELDSPFTQESEEHVTRRIQLSWISPLTSTYLFVDEAGTKTEMRGLKDLARAMLNGRARVTEPPPQSVESADDTTASPKHAVISPPQRE